MTASPAPERDFRGPGCTRACVVVQALLSGRFGRSDLLLHDPESHERFGQATAVSSSDPVRTGSLVVNRSERTVQSNGRHVHLTWREWQILEYLAEALGRIRTTPEIVDSVWGPGWGDNGHALRINLGRLRSKLGSNGALIQNSTGVGYRLASSAPVDVDVPLPLVAKPWARVADCCQTCGLTEYPHAAHGRCTQCRSRLRRAQRRAS